MSNGAARRSSTWAPKATGSYRIGLAIDDRSIPTKRLDSGFYERTIDVDEVA